MKVRLAVSFVLLHGWAWVATSTPIPALPALSEPTEPLTEAWTLWYSVSARIRGGRGAADLEAGGRLSMLAERGSSGTLRLILSEVIEHPWKRYSVDPRGPWGEEAKVAYVVTLPEGTWGALDAARAASAADGARRHQRWLEGAQRPRRLDGTFAFVVIGDARGRFGVTIDPSGAVSKVINRMTDRWLPGPFDQFVGTWGALEVIEASEAGDAPSDAGDAVEGYWFWNRGEREPFEYEPHTYHGLAAALDLLGLPPPRFDVGETAGAAALWTDLTERAIRILDTLAPRAGSRAALSDASGAPEGISLSPATRSTPPGGGTRLVVKSRPGASGPHVQRETVFSSRGWPIADRMHVRLNATNGDSLEVEIGYEPIDQEEGPR